MQLVQLKFCQVDNNIGRMDDLLANSNDDMPPDIVDLMQDTKTVNSEKRDDHEKQTSRSICSQ